MSDNLDRFTEEKPVPFHQISTAEPSPWVSLFVVVGFMTIVSIAQMMHAMTLFDELMKFYKGESLRPVDGLSALVSLLTVPVIALVVYLEFTRLFRR